MEDYTDNIPMLFLKKPKQSEGDKGPNSSKLKVRSLERIGFSKEVRFFD